MKLDAAQKILGGALKAFAAEDGTSPMRAEIATCKAAGVLAMGLGSRTLLKADP